METSTSLGYTNLLNTPLTIYEAVREYFPCSRFQIVAVNPISLDITLKENIIIRIQSAVHKVLFQKSLLQVKLGLPHDSRFATEKPLSGVQGFAHLQRQSYESNGGSCLNVITHYLRNQNQESFQKLISLGLAPGQLTLEVALPYFSEIGKRFADLHQNLKAKYPEMFSLVQTELLRQDLASNTSPLYFEETLSQLRARVLGQEGALKKVAATLAEDKQTNGNHRAFLFVGPTGVGKTELAMAVGDVKGKFIVFYMNQYPNEHDTSRFFGAPLGYLGSNDKPDLAKELDKCPDRSTSNNGQTIIIKNAVLLFDELEKTHPTMRQSLLTILEKGEVAISYTQSERGAGSDRNVKLEYKLVNCVIIATSNLYQNEILYAFQQGMSENNIVKLFETLNLTHGNGYSPELLGRTKVVPFGPIPVEIYKQLLQLKIKKFFEELKRFIAFKEIAIENDHQFFECLKEKLYGNGTNIRKVKSYFDEVKSIIASHQSRWGDITNKKIIFYSNQEGLWVKLQGFVLGEYADLPSPSSPVSIELR